MITTNNARIEVKAGTGDNAWADIHSICNGLVETVQFTPEYGGAFFIAHRLNEPKRKALIIAPSEKWAGDITDDGWVIEVQLRTNPIEQP